MLQIPNYRQCWSKGGGGGGRRQMYLYYTNRGAHMYLAPDGNTPCSATAYRYPHKAYNVFHSLDTAGWYTWYSAVKNILFCLGFGYVWICQDVGDNSLFLALLKERESKRYSHITLDLKMNSSNRYDIYYKYNFTLEPELHLTSAVF